MENEVRNFISKDKKKWYSEEYIKRNFIKKSEVNKDKKINLIDKECLNSKYFSKKDVKRILENRLNNNKFIYKSTRQIMVKEKIKERIAEDKIILEKLNELEAKNNEN